MMHDNDERGVGAAGGDPGTSVSLAESIPESRAKGGQLDYGKLLGTVHLSNGLVEDSEGSLEQSNPKC